MARMGVTYEEVELQAETLVAKGENPTLEKVRRALGDRGSNSTLSKYINEWRGRRAQSSPNNPNSILQVSDPVNEAVNRVWQQLKEESQLEIFKIKEETRLSLEEAHLHKKQLSEERDRAFSELQELQNYLGQLKAENINLKSELQKVQNQYEVVIGRLEEAEKYYQDYKNDKEKQILELRNSAKDRQQQRNELEMTLRQARENIGRLEEKLRQLTLIKLSLQNL